MAIEYYRLEEPNNLGVNYLQISVFKEIVLKTLKEIDGINLAEGTMDIIRGSRGPLTIEVTKSNQLKIKANVVVDYGLNVNSLVKTAQKDLASAIKNYTSVKNPKISLNVDRIKF